MSIFAEFERKVVKTLIMPHLHQRQVEAVLDSAILVSLEHTGVGRFLKIKHPSLPSERIVCHKPLATGISANVECGFVLFLYNGELTREFHSWGNQEIPMDIRERQLKIEIVTH